MSSRAARRTLVICPGRGTYTADDLGYLGRRLRDPRCPAAGDIVAEADYLRQQWQSRTITELDQAERFSAALHMAGPNAGPLIFTCSAVDYMAIPKDRFDIVAVAGNSMGWYTSLFVSGCLTFPDALRLVDTMSKSQQGKIKGGQIIVPWVDEDWQPDWERRRELLEAVTGIQKEGRGYAALSIDLGGYLVLAGDDQGLALLREAVPPFSWGGREYPFQLAQHAAFHTSLMADASAFGHKHLADLPWHTPAVTAVDGCGFMHRPLTSTRETLRSWTLGPQVVDTYDFTLSIRVALREFAPDVLVLPGPGTTLGGAIGQAIVLEGWQGIHSKGAFLERQKSSEPLLLALGREDQFEAMFRS